MALTDRFARQLICYAHPDARTVQSAHRHGALSVWEHLVAAKAATPISARARNVDLDEVYRREQELARHNACFITPEDLSWPALLNDLPEDQRPLGLWVRGSVDLRVATARSVAIVGSRACTSYGERVALGMAGDLAHKGWTITSGGAIGIDAAAHQGALAVGGTTIAVLANGIDIAYPRSHDSLFEQIAAHGALVSEVPPGEPPARYRFLERNRLIAALSKGTVVVEASARSGALSTSSKANALERVVMAVPGPVTSAASSGAHRLIQEGAALVTGADDVCDRIDVLDPTRTWQQDVLDPHDNLDAQARSVLDAMPAKAPSSLERLAIRTGLSVQAVHMSLGTLVVAGLVEQSRGQWRLTHVGRSGTRRSTSGTISM